MSKNRLKGISQDKWGHYRTGYWHSMPYMPVWMAIMTFGDSLTITKDRILLVTFLHCPFLLFSLQWCWSISCLLKKSFWQRWHCKTTWCCDVKCSILWSLESNFSSHWSHSYFISSSFFEAQLCRLRRIEVTKWWSQFLHW